MPTTHSFALVSVRFEKTEDRETVVHFDYDEKNSLRRLLGESNSWTDPNNKDHHHLQQQEQHPCWKTELIPLD